MAMLLISLSEGTRVTNMAVVLGKADMIHVAGRQLMDSVNHLNGSRGWTTMENFDRDKKKLVGE